MEYKIVLSPEEEKALLTDMLSIQDWLDNAIHNKSRQCIDEVCHRALEDQSNTILTVEEKRQLRDHLDQQGIVLTSVKQLPVGVKNQIVAHARVKSAAERNKEMEANP